MTNKKLIQTAQAATTKAYPLSAKKEEWQYMGYVGAAIETSAGNIHTGVNLSLLCGIGFCAEHSAAAAMIQQGETRVVTMVAVTNDGKVLPPCGRCRELTYQLDKDNLQAKVIVNEVGKTVLLKDLLPDIWQERIGL